MVKSANYLQYQGATELELSIDSSTCLLDIGNSNCKLATLGKRSTLHELHQLHSSEKARQPVAFSIYIVEIHTVITWVETSVR